MYKLLVAAALAVVADAQPRAFTASAFTGFQEPVVEVMLYNPPVHEVTWKYPYKRDTTIRKIETRLAICGKGIPDGSYTLNYRIEGNGESLHTGTAEVAVTHGGFEKRVTLATSYPQATAIAYELVKQNGAALKGSAALRWSRFHGQVTYLDGGWRSTYIELSPNGFNSIGGFWVPVGEDGRFDALLPARIYSVVNVNGAGYAYDAMERWAWDYDLTRDREDVFTIGRTELYSIHAFDIKGPISTVFVAFRPTALSRLLRHDTDGNGRVEGPEWKPVMAAMTESPTVIGPELDASDVTVWLNGKTEKIVQFNRVPEYDGKTWQVQYLLQIFPDPRPARGVWHEIKLHVTSKDTRNGKEVVDFGEGSVGFYRH